MMNFRSLICGFTLLSAMACTAIPASAQKYKPPVPIGPNWPTPKPWVRYAITVANNTNINVNYRIDGINVQTASGDTGVGYHNGPIGGYFFTVSFDNGSGTNTTLNYSVPAGSATQFFGRDDGSIDLSF